MSCNLKTTASDVQTGESRETLQFVLSEPFLSYLFLGMDLITGKDRGRLYLLVVFVLFSHFVVTGFQLC